MTDNHEVPPHTHAIPRHQYDRVWKSTKLACERDDCGHLVPDEAMNCVNKCTSPKCFGDVFGPDKGGPLEDGEVDYDRNRKFHTCLRNVRGTL